MPVASRAESGGGRHPAYAPGEGAVSGHQVAHLLGVPSIPDVVGDLAQRPCVSAWPVPPRQPGRQQPEGRRQSGQPFGGLDEVSLGEPGPVDVDRDEAGVPAVGAARHLSETCLHLGEMVDEVVGVAANRLVRRVYPVVVLAQLGVSVSVPVAAASRGLNVTDSGRQALQTTFGTSLDAELDSVAWPVRQREGRFLRTMGTNDGTERPGCASPSVSSRLAPVPRHGIPHANLRYAGSPPPGIPCAGRPATGEP